jgi:hypothetical protein
MRGEMGAKKTNSTTGKWFLVTRRIVVALSFHSSKPRFVEGLQLLLDSTCVCSYLLWKLLLCAVFVIRFGMLTSLFPSLLSFM